jgi:nitronate monooxygenase
MARFSLTELREPIVQAPMAGGPSTPALAAAVAEAGALGFLAMGYRTPQEARADIRALRELTDRPFGVNLIAPPGPPVERAALVRYAETLEDEAVRYGVPLGEPRHDDDGFEAKLAVVREERVPVASFTFGCPAADAIRGLQDAGTAVWVTVTTQAEARHAQAAGVDALVVQGVEAGGHRGSFDDDAPGLIGLLALLQLTAAAVDLPLVASGGIATGEGVAAVLAAGASAAQLGTAFLLAAEAETSATHCAALGGDAETALTRAFTGRTARGVVNRFLREHTGHAPAGYPEVHHLTAPIRAAARAQGNADGIHLWAGQAHPLAEPRPAGELVRHLGAGARRALRDAARRVDAS